MRLNKGKSIPLEVVYETDDGILFYDNINFLRNQNNLSQLEVGILVEKTRASVSLWERNERLPSLNDLKILSNYFNVSIDDLINKDLRNETLTDTSRAATNCSKIPVLKNLPKDLSLNTLKDLTTYWIDIPSEWIIGNREYFGIKMTDNNMQPNYQIDDTVILQSKTTYRNGDDCIVVISNNKPEFKRIIKQSNGLNLLSLNDYQTKYYTEDEIEKLPIKILGVAVEVRRRVGR